MKKLTVLLFSVISFICHAQYDISITGEDTLCIGQNSQYSAEVNLSSNQYLFRDTTGLSSGGNGYFALNAGYDWMDITNTFTYDFWVQPTRTINMYGESNVCAGGVSVPLANSNQNWALVPVGLAGGSMSVGLTIGTNGLMVGEHSGNILVSRLSYTTPITDWVHVAIVYRTDSIFLYLDGNLVRSRPTHCSANEKCITSGLTGYYYGPDFKGNFDEFRLWDVALTHQQIQEIKDKKIINQVDGLRYYASFDNGEFVRTLGDLGDVNMTVSLINNEEYIKKSNWELNKYTGPDIENLTAFVTEDFNYQWSTGETTQNIYYSPVDSINYISVEAYNDHYSLIDTMEITGINCCQEIYYDTLVVYDTVTQSKQDLQYLLYESYYSEDFGQVNVYEISAYSEGTNVALNKSTFTNSCEGGGENCGGPAVDGNDFSRWSSDRNDAGPDSANPHFIVVDLGEEFNLDSIILNIEGFDRWDQTFAFFGSPDSVNWYLISEGQEITGIFSYDSLTYDQAIHFDTLIVEVHDTTYITTYDTIYEPTPAFQYPVYREGDIKYVKFESFYSEDRNQVNVYEIQAFDEGMNVALNKPSFANSTPQGSYSAVDGSDNSRWSANRYEIGPDYANPHFILVDLQDSYLLDSIYLNIKGFDSWNQTFNVLVSNDSAKWYLVTSEVDTTGIFTYPLRTWNIITVHDTITTTIENHVSVTDTLIIDAVLTGIAGPDNINTLKVYPNPARDFLYINTGDYARMNGYRLKIMNQLGAVVFETNVEDPLYQVNLSTWSGKGLYFIQLIDSGDMIIDIRKIILQ